MIHSKIANMKETVIIAAIRIIDGTLKNTSKKVEFITSSKENKKIAMNILKRFHNNNKI